MGYRIRFATCHGQYRSVHCHRVDRQALNYDKIKMSLYGNTATFFGAADRIRTCGLSGRSRTIYPAELQPHIYENRHWDEIHRMKFCESLE